MPVIRRTAAGRPIRAIVSLIIPLFISAFQRSDDLACAMEARGYDPQAKRTRYRVNRWRKRDRFAMAFILLFFGGILCLMFTRFDLVVWISSLCG